ncbi:MAG: DUF2779 domain-containing protein [Mollicutes bacterium PWAP]|nr:DUF2779 domain-containing protein [Mollicutes bacterium PWAP]
MEKEELIKYKNFKNLYTSEAYFIWNNFEDNYKLKNINENIFKEINFKENSLWGVSSDNISSFNSNWTFENLGEVESISSSEIIVKTFGAFREPSYSWIKNKAKSLGVNLIDSVSSSGIKGFEETMKLFEKDSILVINPSFINNGVFARPFAALKKENNLFIWDLKFSKKLNSSDVLKTWFNSTIIKRSMPNLNLIFRIISPMDGSYSNLTKHLENHEKDLYDRHIYKKNEIKFIEMDKISITKSGSSILDISKKGKNWLKIDELISKDNFQKGKNFILNNFDNRIFEIREAKKINKIYKSNFEDNFNFIEDNPNLKKIIEFHFGNDIAETNAKVVPSKLKNNSKTFLLNNIETYSKYNYLLEKKLYHVNQQDSEFISLFSKMKSAKKIVWYDYESFSQPFSSMDSAPPYSQMCFQSSVIRTNLDSEVYKKNIVEDTKKYSIESLINVVDSVYWSEADFYVVYNKNFESARNKELIKYLEDNKHSRLNEMRKKIESINNLTIDLCDFFSRSTQKKLSPIVLYDQKLRYSIKNIEKHISNNNIKVPRPIKEYKNLSIKDGIMAMDLGIKRNLGLINDHDWIKYTKQLADYCENDVRAMIMVWDFVLMLTEGDLKDRVIDISL